jgi:hypothetical protein
VTERRVAPMRIVPPLDKLEKLPAGLGMRSKRAPVQKLTFQGSKEAFAQSIIEAVSHRSHRRSYPGFPAPLAKSNRRLLAALVGVMNYLPGLSLPQGHVQSVQNELCAKMPGHRPAHHPPRGLSTAHARQLILLHKLSHSFSIEPPSLCPELCVYTGYSIAAPGPMRTHLHAYARRIYNRPFRAGTGLSRYMPSHPDATASYAISVRQASALLSRFEKSARLTFRFHLAVDTLAVRLTVPPAGSVEDLNLLVGAP